MPVVSRPTGVQNEAGGERSGWVEALFPRCGNPDCRTGWIHVWRHRRWPVFEGRWACSPPCLEALVAAAVRREMGGSEGAGPLRPHRVPMGLMLLEQGAITAGQLQEALAGQRQAAAEGGEARRLGAWLMESGVLREPALMRALSVQWNCPVYTLDGFRPEETTTAMPRLLSDVFDAIPLRVDGQAVLRVAFAGGVDRSLSYALQRMSGLRVVAGLVSDAAFRRARESYAAAAAPPVDYVEAANSWVFVRMAVRRLERAKAAAARLVRVHDLYWLRVWRRSETAPGLPAPGTVEDVLATLGPRRPQPIEAGD
jgi:hypothetical protein